MEEAYGEEGVKRREEEPCLGTVQEEQDAVASRVDQVLRGEQVVSCQALGKEQTRQELR